MRVPELLHTSQLTLRPWRATDAAELLPVLEANQAHLGPWIPVGVSAPAPIPELEARLNGFAADFADDRVWRYGLFSRNGTVQDTNSACDVLAGEIALFPRSSTARVPFAEADRIEIGYWLRADLTGKGLVTEAARLMVEVARTLPGIRSVEIRCDELNASSAAVPRRLGFALDADSNVAVTKSALSGAPLQVWMYPLDQVDGGTSFAEQTANGQ